MMFQFAAMTSPASRSGRILFALAALVPALWWHSTHRLALAEVFRPERPVWELLPPANAPPGTTGGSS